MNRFLRCERLNGLESVIGISRIATNLQLISCRTTMRTFANFRSAQEARLELFRFRLLLLVEKK
jgi:hypothetical protein